MRTSALDYLITIAGLSERAQPTQEELPLANLYTLACAGRELSGHAVKAVRSEREVRSDLFRTGFGIAAPSGSAGGSFDRTRPAVDVPSDDPTRKIRECPAWSPDGERGASVIFDCGDGYSELMFFSNGMRRMVTR